MTKYDYKIVTLVNIYTPNNEKDKTDLLKILINNSIDFDNIVLSGDFICQFDNERGDKTVNILKCFCLTLSLKDS